MRVGLSPSPRDAGATLRPVERDAARTDVRGREEPEPQRLVDVARGASDDGREREQHDRREPGRTDDATEVVDRAEAEARAVEAAPASSTNTSAQYAIVQPGWNARDSGGPAPTWSQPRQREHDDVDCHAAEPPAQTRPETEPEVPALERGARSLIASTESRS